MKLTPKNKWNIRIRILMLTALVFHSCNQEEETKELMIAASQQTKIVTAKKWFEDYKARIAVNPQFSDLTYHWEIAFENTLEDGSKAIVIPLTENHPNPEYKGEKVLYLYPFEQGYDALVQELIPQSHKITKKEILQNLDTYTGYIITWNLEKGFVKGAKFENSIAVKTLNLKTETKLHSLTGREAAIELDEVLVSSGSATSAAPRDFSIGATVGGGGAAPKSGAYITPPHGATDSDTPVAVNTNPCDKIKELLNSPAFKAKLNALKLQTSLTKENGFAQKKDGTFVTLIAKGSDAVTIPRDFNMVGFMHTHVNTYDKLNADGDLVPLTPIKMFSPDDVRQFLIIVNNAQNNNIPISNTYGVMVSSTGTYQLKFTGNVADISAKYDTINWGYDLDEIYKTYLDKNIESGFLQFLKDKIGIDGIELYRIETAGNSRKALDSAGKITTVNCN